VPFCTLKMFPEETLHCVEWARDKFSKLFTQKPQSTINLIEKGESFMPESQQDHQMLKQGMSMLKKRPTSFMDCIQFARMQFEKYFSHEIQQLLYTYPLDMQVKGKPFWSLPKRPPGPLVFDKKNPKHQMFIASLACLRATIFHIEIPTENPRSDKFRAQAAEDADYFKPPPFKPNDAKAKEIQDQVNKQDNKDTQEEEQKEDDKEKIDEDVAAQRLADFKKELPKITVAKDQIEKQFISREDFEKDNDKNFHIDFIYSMANCRSLNYKLDEMDWLTVKLKAGKIVPALATTTASIAALQTLEMIKVLTKTE